MQKAIAVHMAINPGLPSIKTINRIIKKTIKPASQQRVLKGYSAVPWLADLAAIHRNKAMETRAAIQQPAVMGGSLPSIVAEAIWPILEGKIQNLIAGAVIKMEIPNEDIRTLVSECVHGEFTKAFSFAGVPVTPLAAFKVNPTKVKRAIKAVEQAVHREEILARQRVVITGATSSNASKLEGEFADNPKVDIRTYSNEDKAGNSNLARYMNNASYLIMTPNTNESAKEIIRNGFNGIVVESTNGLEAIRSAVKTVESRL